MKTPTKYSTCLVEDDKKVLTSFQPAKKESLFVDTGIEAFPAISQKGIKGITVFLVDDDLIYLTAMEHFLLEEVPTLKIRSFETGESCLMELDQFPDVVILDYYLDSEVSSAENGIKILKRIKDISPKTNVVMLSCEDESKIAKTSIKQGAFDYIPKGERAFSRIKYILMNLSGDNDFWID